MFTAKSVKDMKVSDQEFLDFVRFMASTIFI